MCTCASRTRRYVALRQIAPICISLSHNIGASELAHDVRKRLAALRTSKTRISWRKRKSLVTDLNTQVAMIVQKIAPDHPNTAFDLLWQFIELAPSIFARADDRRGDIGVVFQNALQHFEDIGPRTQIDEKALAERVWAALSESTHGEWDDIIGLLAETMGPKGLDTLRQHVQDFADAPERTKTPDHEAFEFLRSLRGERDYRLKLAQGQADEALAILEGADMSRGPFGQEAWDIAYIDTLLALDRNADAQARTMNF